MSNKGKTKHQNITPFFKKLMFNKNFNKISLSKLIQQNMSFAIQLFIDEKINFV